MLLLFDLTRLQPTTRSKELPRDAGTSEPTDKILKAEQYISDRDGLGFRTRGLNIAIAWRLVKALLIYIAPLDDRNFLGWLVYTAALEVLLSSFHAALIHKLVSLPSTKYFWQRIPGFNTWLKLLPSAVPASFATSTNFYLPWCLARLFRDAGRGILFGIICTPLIYFFAVAPARAIFIRVVAFLLPEEDQPIPTLDRALTGIDPVSRQERRTLSVTDAWSSFQWSARWRYVKALAIVFVFEFILWCYIWLFVLNRPDMGSRVLHFLA